MTRILGAGLLAAVALAASACGSTTHRATTSAAGSSTRLILGGAVRCTATLRTPVQVGDTLGFSVSFHNISKRAISVQPSYGGMWVVVKSSDGTTYDTRVPLENSQGPPPAPIPLRPGATVARHLLPDLRVRWEGPLRITPGCDVHGAPPVRVAVTSPGSPANATKALRNVVAATGHLLDHCRPRTPGVSVLGRIDAPENSAPPMPARCSITLERKNGFYVAQVLALTPPDLHGVHVDPTYDALTGGFAHNRNTQIIAWQFVVTREGATSVAAADNATGQPGGGRAPSWRWNSSGPTRSGSSLCGFSGGSFGSGDGPDVFFVSGCGR